MVFRVMLLGEKAGERSMVFFFWALGGEKARSRVRHARTRLAHQKICIVQFCNSDKSGITTLCDRRA